jgi:hypothetical protein
LGARPFAEVIEVPFPMKLALEFEEILKPLATSKLS